MSEEPKPRISKEEMEARIEDALHTNLTLTWNNGPQQFYEEEWAARHDGTWTLKSAYSYVEGR